MNVFGVKIDQSAIDEAVASIANDGLSFTARDLEQRLKDCGVDAKSAYRCADRTLQKLRKRGHISFSSSRGAWVFI